MNRLSIAALSLALVTAAGGAFAADVAQATPTGAVAATTAIGHHSKLRDEVMSGALTPAQAKAKELHADKKALHAKHRAMVQENTGAAPVTK